MDTKRNGNGQTLEEFLHAHKDAYGDGWTLTVDNVLFSIVDEKLVVLLIKRANFPDMDDWALPGGIVEKGESCETAAARELAEETGLADIELEQLHVVSTPNRDPRGCFVSSCFMGVLPEPLPCAAGDDAAQAKWFFIDYAALGDDYELVLKSDDLVLNAVMNIKRLPNGKIDINNSKIISKTGIAFDHAKVVLYAVEML